MGSRKPDDNKGKGKSILDDKEKTPASSTPPGDNQMHLPPQIAAELTPIIAGDMFPQVSLSQIPWGNIVLVARYQLAQIYYIPLLSYGNMSPQSSIAQVLPPFGHSYSPRGIGIEIAERSNIQPLISNQIPTLFGTHLVDQHHILWGGNHQTGPSHDSVPVQTGNNRPGAADNIMGEGSIPESCNILGKRAHDGSPDGPSKKIATSPVRSNASPPVALQDSSQPLQPSGNECTLCKRVVNEQKGMRVLPCGHFFHDHKIIDAWQSQNPPCIPCLLNACQSSF